MQKIFRYSRWDAVSVAVIPLQLAAISALAAWYRELPLWALLALVPAVFALNIQGTSASHNHYHTPFFMHRWMNTLARMGFSAIGSPKTPLNIGHGLHHATPMSWDDASFLQIMGLKRPLVTQVLAFAQYVVDSFGLKYFIFMVLLRIWPLERVAAYAAPNDVPTALRFFRKLTEARHMRDAHLDLAAWLAFRIVLCAIDWRFFLFYWVPVSYLIEMLRATENFLQHWGANAADDAKRDSVSCYGVFYNLLTFNLGYHQEHHLKPGTHWRSLPRVTLELPPDRRVVPLSHYVNVPIFYPALARSLREKAAAAAAKA